VSGLGTRQQEGVRTSVDVVYERTRAAIVRGVYPPGAPLKIQELAETNSVSLTPVREALRVLAAEGFVEAIRNRVVRVAPISQAEILDIYNVRAQLEVAALRQAFDHLTPELVRKANELNRQCIDLLRDGDERFFEIHEALHFMLYDQCQSKWLMRFIKTVWAHSERCRWLSSPPHIDLEDAKQQHVALLNALEMRDLDRSLEALEAHIKHNLEVLLRVRQELDRSSAIVP
jgi:DNA-binding GntR family transcriptional regulator